MKRILAIALSVFMMLSICTVFASALPGTWGTTADDFAPAGKMEINWDPNAANTITFDGDLDEWVSAGYNKYEISPRNMVSWVGTVDADWKMECFFVADSEKLYVAFYITDSDFSCGASPVTYNDGSGDAFQMAFDWGHNVGDALVNDEYAVTNPQDIFYSFNCIEGENLQFKRDNSDRDGMVYEGSEEEAGEEWDEDWPEFAKDNEWVGMEGAYGTTETGWCAEFSVTWQRLASDAYYKLWDAEFFRTAKIGANQDLEIGCALYYLNSAAKDDGSRALSWAAGTTQGATDDAGTPQVNWTSDEDGLTLVLKYQDGMTFGENTGIEVLAEGETEGERSTGDVEPEETEEPTEPATGDAEPATEPATGDAEPATEPATGDAESATEPATGDAEPATGEDESKADATEAATKADATEAATKADATTAGATETDTAVAEEEGCSSVIGAGAAALVLSAMAAAVALKKKH